jgi:hypothetical protein
MGRFIRSRVGRGRPLSIAGGCRTFAILLGPVLKGIARKAIGEVLVHADTLRRILANQFLEQAIVGKFKYRFQPEVGKVTLKSHGDEALSDESF